MMIEEQTKITCIENGSVISPPGFQVAGLHSGVKKARNDLGVLYSEKLTNAAAVYTLNQIQAAPIAVTKESMHVEHKLQAIVINSGNANACTGKQGEEDAYMMQHLTAKKLSLPAHHVAVASTGVIGVHMPMSKIAPHIDLLSIGKTKEHVAQFEQSLLTTDTFTKSACYQAEIGGNTITIGGAAKGSGMVKPNMGTILSFITTDAAIESEFLQMALKEATDKTFNCITVDGDTSTNDMVIVLANGLAENDTLTPEHPDWKVFMELLTKTCEDLSQQIARDGEGATKLVEVEVIGAKTNEDAVKIAKAIVSSSLVKTAIFGKDANWGRIIAAIGYSGVEINPHTIDAMIGPISILQNSEPMAFSEEEINTYFENDTVKILIDLQLGDAKGKAWGCDLTYDYVRINASYRT